MHHFKLCWETFLHENENMVLKDCTSLIPCEENFYHWSRLLCLTFVNGRLRRKRVMAGHWRGGWPRRVEGERERGGGLECSDKTLPVIKLNFENMFQNISHSITTNKSGGKNPLLLTSPSINLWLHLNSSKTINLIKLVTWNWHTQILMLRSNSLAELPQDINLSME